MTLWDMLRQLKTSECQACADTGCKRQCRPSFGQSGIFLPLERTKFKVYEKVHELLQLVSHKISCSSWPLREHPPWQVCSQHQGPEEPLVTREIVQWENWQVHCDSRRAFELSADLTSIRLWGGFLAQVNGDQPASWRVQELVWRNKV